MKNSGSLRISQQDRGQHKKSLIRSTHTNKTQLVHIDFSDSYSESSDVPTIKVARREPTPISSSSYSEGAEDSSKKPAVNWNPKKKTEKKPIHEPAPYLNEEESTNDIEEVTNDEESIPKDDTLECNSVFELPDQVPMPVFPELVGTNTLDVVSVIRMKTKFPPSTKITMITKDSHPLFYSKIRKEGNRRIGCISTHEDASFNTEGYCGFVREEVHDTTFLVASSHRKERDDRDGELLGSHFSNGKLTFAIPSNGRENYAISKRLSLFQVAAKISENTERFLLFNSTEFSTDLIGSTFYAQSIKNFVIVNQNNEVIFAFFKTTTDTYTLQYRSPLTQLQAFGLSIAIIMHK